jgi:predicted RNA-binding Zn-ribbon protein involved in translation (DUF1610 family)
MATNGGEYNIERAMAALEQAGAKLDCPSCGGQDWSRNPDPVALPTMVPDGNLLPAAPAYMLVCTKCGFVRLHSTKTLHGDKDASR